MEQAEHDAAPDRVGDVLGGVGDVLGGVDDVLGGVDDVLGGVDDVLGGVGDVLGGVDDVLGGVGDVGRALGGVGNALDGVGDVGRALDGVGGVGRALDGVGDVGRALDGVGDVGDALDDVGDVGRALDGVGGPLDRVDVAPCGEARALDGAGAADSAAAERVGSSVSPPTRPLEDEARDTRIAEDERGERIAEMAAHLDAATHRLLAELREFDASGAWMRQGARSCAAWLSWRLGWSGGKAREHVRIARQLAKLPRIDDALRRGELSYCKVRAITRVATPANEPVLLHDARHTTGEQLETLCRKYAIVQRGEARTPLDDRLERHVRRYAVHGGMVRVEATLHPEEAELVWEALTVAARARKAGATEVHDAEADVRAADAEGDAATIGGPGSAAVAMEPAGRTGGVARTEAAPGARVAPGVVADAVAVASAVADSATGAAAGAGPAAITVDDAVAVADTASVADAAPVADADAVAEADADAVAEADAAPVADADDGWLDRILDEAGILPDQVLERPRAVQTAAIEPARTRAAPAEPVITAFDRAQALVELAQSVLRGTRRDRSPTELVVTIPIERLTGPAAEGLPAALVGSGTGVSAETAQRLACDCGVVALVEGAKGEVLSVGRRTRTIHASMKRALLHRDRTCRFPGCGNRVFLEGHHIKHWASGGETRLENLLAMCSFHHTFVHDYGFTIELAEDGEVEFRSPDGAPKPAVPQVPPRPDRGWPAIQAANQNLEISAATPACGWDGRPVRYDWVLDDLIRADEVADTDAGEEHREDADTEHEDEVSNAGDGR